MVKVAINECYGGFGLSRAGEARLRGLGWDGDYVGDVDRTDPRLIQVIEELGGDSNDGYSELAVVEVPDGVQWHIEEYDGLETVAEGSGRHLG